MAELFDETWVLYQKARADMTHEDRVAYVRYLAMWSNREPGTRDISTAALCLPDTTRLDEALAAARDVSGGQDFIVCFRGTEIPPEKQRDYTLGDLSDLTMMV